MSLSSQEGFQQAADIMTGFFAKFIVWGILTALAYHICGGVRHMLMDFGYLEENLAVGSLSAKVAIGIAVILSILAGVLVW
ncbi:succinate dehydrogenase, cytochrome b556 subunit [Photorhabdus laumondii subsp. laumondii]|nr:succinate dehydrogenase, cytochrome b556 subunit [Photorhabdus laumondii subsp. laumondii]